MENHGHELLLMIFSNVKVAIATVFKGMIAMAFMVFIDSVSLISMAYVLLGLHVFTGLWVKWKTGAEWDKEKWFKTCMKILWFPAVIVANKMLKETHSIDIPLGVIASGLLCVNEMKGFIDNAGKLMGIDLWNALSEQIDWKKFKLKQ